MPDQQRLPLLARLLRSYLRTNLSGRTRLPRLAATLIPALRNVPVALGGDQVLFLDMRDPMCRDVLRDSPYSGNPWEPDEQLVLRRLVRAGDVALDIGAHFGEHAMLLSRLVGPSGKVVAFEPNPERHASLGKTLRQATNTRLFPVALADQPGAARLYVPEYHVTASLADWTKGRVGPVHEVTCTRDTLDAFVGRGDVPQPQFIKCDVEGAELLVFRGAALTLDREDAPIVMYEANRPGAEAFGFSISASTEFLRGLLRPRFAFYWVQPRGTLVRVDSLGPDVDLFNLVAIPAVMDYRLNAT